MSWPGPSWAPFPGLVLLSVLSSVDGQVCGSREVQATRSSVLTEHEVQVQGFDGAESETLPTAECQHCLWKNMQWFLPILSSPSISSNLCS